MHTHSKFRPSVHSIIAALALVILPFGSTTDALAQAATPATAQPSQAPEATFNTPADASTTAATATLATGTQPATKAAQPPVISEERLRLAGEYIALLPIERDIQAAINDAVTRIPTEQRVLYRSIAEKGVDFERLKTAARLNAAEIFTEAELKAMIAFYSTPEGQSAREKLQNYDRRMIPILNEVLAEFAKRVEEAGITVNP